jgi:uncharacterized protein YkwD
MAARGSLTHDGEGSLPERLASVGLHPNGIGKTIAQHPGTAHEVVTLWLASPPHRSVLSGPSTALGAGRVGQFWGVDFAIL